MSSLDRDICEAASRGDRNSVHRLHQLGANLQAHGKDMLCLACEGGHLKVVQYLHENGVPISARAGDGTSEPLRWAAAGGHVEVVKYLHTGGAVTRLLKSEALHTIEEMWQELRAAPVISHPSDFWMSLSKFNEQLLDWGGEGNFKRTFNQNYFNFVPSASDDPHMVRMRRLTPHVLSAALDAYEIEDPDRDPSSWMSCYPGYYIFKEPDRAAKLRLYREYLARMYEYALERDGSSLLAKLQEPTLGNPIRVLRNGRLISQDIVNSLRERNALVGAIQADEGTRFIAAELGAGYGRLGYLLLKTTKCRYFVFDIPPALYVSQWYLTTLFPERYVFRFRRFERFEEVEEELSHADIAFLTANQLTKFPPGYFDVFATISTLHEMRLDQISHYMALLGRTSKAAVYIKQQNGYVNPVDKLVIGKDAYPVPAGWALRQERFDLINPRFFERIYHRPGIAADRTLAWPHRARRNNAA